jgi:phosphotriesterase-related protein
VVGTGHYRDPYLDVDWFDRHGIEMIAELLVRDIEQGMAGTGIRAGIIGEIGADKWFVSALEERSFRAAARAQRRTGLAITTHAARWPVGLAQLDIVQSEGVDPRRVIIGHCDSVNLPEYHEKIVARGAFVQFDTIRGRSTYDIRLRVELVMNLVKHGYVDQILLSHDVCTTSHLSSYGGGGYTVVGTIFREALLEAGLAPEEFDHISIDNPRRALTGGT